MSETELEVTKYLDTMRTMDDYLDYLDYNGIYTQLDGREDWFLSLTKWLKGFKGEGSKRAFDGYKEADVDDLQLVCYDYIRAKHGGALIVSFFCQILNQPTKYVIKYVIIRYTFTTILK
jgi:hypothetical protein